MNIPMPPRDAAAEVVACAAAKCIRLACMEHFATTKLGDVSEVVSGGTPPTDDPEYWDGGIVWVTPMDLGRRRNIEVESSERMVSERALSHFSVQLVPAGTVLLSSRAPIGRLGIAAIPLATNQGFKNIVCSERLHNRFLFHMLRGSIDELVAEGRGIARTFLHLPKKVLRHFQVPLPPRHIQHSIAAFLDALYLRLAGQNSDFPTLPPALSEQQRIVARIEELATKITSARFLKQHTKFGIDQFWKVLSRISRTTKYPERMLGDMVEFLDRRRVPLSEAERTNRKGPYAYFGASGIIDSIDEYIFDEPLVLLSEDGTNLINRSMPIAFIASGKYWVNNHAHVLRPIEAIADINFLAYALSDYDVSSFNFASAQPKLNQKNARQIRFPLPPVPEQRRIVTYLDALQKKADSVKLLQAETSAELDGLLPAILAKAFRGGF